MYGFSIILNRTSETCASYNLKGQKTIAYRNVLISQHKFKKFSQDKVFEENEAFIIGIDGVILNLHMLINRYAAPSNFALMVSLYDKFGAHFPGHLKGEFSGFLFDKKSNELFVFMNKTKSKQIFYTVEHDFVAVSPSLDEIVAYRSAQGLTNALSIQSCYHLMTFGGMIENETLVSDIKQLCAGEYVKVTTDTVSIEKYFDYNEIDYSINSKATAINRLNETFEAALKLEYQKDASYDYDHLATLSGGLDSRMNVFVAHEFNFTNAVFCFSQSDYLDERISRKISLDYGLDYAFIPLDGGPYLQDLDEMLSINFGQQAFLGAAHLNYALKNISQISTGIIHTGMAGDALLGGFLADNNYYSKIMSDTLVHKCKPVSEIQASYLNEEVFKLQQRIFNFINFGFSTIENTGTYGVSPFMDDDFIIASLSIEPRWKHKDKIYIDWINERHPKVGEYVWEKTGFRPDKKWKTPLSRYSKKLNKEFQIMLKRQDRLSMNPLEYWVNNDESHQVFFNRTFEEHWNLMDANPELKKDIQYYFEKGSVMCKGAALTILASIKRYNLKV